MYIYQDDDDSDELGSEMDYEDAGDEDDPDDFWATAKWLKGSYTSSLRPEDDGDVCWAKRC